MALGWLATRAMRWGHGVPALHGLRVPTGGVGARSMRTPGHGLRCAPSEPDPAREMSVAVEEGFIWASEVSFAAIAPLAFACIRRAVAGLPSRPRNGGPRRIVGRPCDACPDRIAGATGLVLLNPVLRERLGLPGASLCGRAR